MTSLSIRDGPFGILPIDVYEHIIQCVHSSGPEEDEVLVMQMTLCSCALVCRAWHPRSRFFLYRCLTIYSSQVYSRNRDILQRLARAITSSPFIADLIEDVIISGGSPSAVSGVASTLPLLLGNKLPKLRSLTIQDTALLVNPAFCHSIASFPALTTLTLSYVTLASVTAFRRLLAALPRLYDLTLLYVAFESRGVWATAILCSESQMPRVRRLSIINPLDALMVFLLLARHVERLVMSFYAPLNDVTFASLEGLVFERLTSLTLQSHGPLAEGITEFFSKARANQLRTITVISLKSLRLIERPKGLRGIFNKKDAFNRRWLLEDAILKADLPLLESVTVVLTQTQFGDYKGEGVPEILEEWVVKECRKILSIVHRRGLLRVAAASLVNGRWDEAYVCVWLEEGTNAAPSYTRQYGVPPDGLLDAIVKVLDKTTL